MKWLTLVASSSFIALCTFVLQLTNIYTPFSSCHSSCSCIFITGHFTIHFPIFHLTRLLSTIDRMTHNSMFLVGNLLSGKKKIILGCFTNLLGIPSQVCIVSIFLSTSFPFPRVQWWGFSGISLWVFISSHPANVICEFILLDSMYCH